MNNYKNHTLELRGYETINGKIPFSFLKEFIEQLTSLAESEKDQQF